MVNYNNVDKEIKASKASALRVAQPRVINSKDRSLDIRVDRTGITFEGKLRDQLLPKINTEAKPKNDVRKRQKCDVTKRQKVRH